LQIEDTPTLHLIENRHIYAYNITEQGGFHFDSVKNFIDEKPYLEDDEMVVTPNIESRVRQGEMQQNYVQLIKA